MCAADHIVVDAVFDERRRVAAVEETPGVGLVLGEEQGRLAVCTQRSPPAVGVLEMNSCATASIWRTGCTLSGAHDQVLRNQMVGSNAAVPRHSRG